MKYFKTTSNGYILMISRQIGNIEITAEEYAQIESALKNMPDSRDGYTLMLKESLEWEYVEQEVTDDE